LQFSDRQLQTFGQDGIMGAHITNDGLTGKPITIRVVSRPRREKRGF